MKKDSSFDVGNQKIVYKNVQEWINQHKDIAQFLTFDPGHNLEDRDLVLKRNVRDLTEFMESIENMGNHLSIQSLELEKDNPPFKIVYDSTAHNTICRKYNFMVNKVFRLSSKTISSQICQIMIRITDIRSLLKFLQSNLIPQDTICYVSPTFLSLSSVLSSDSIPVQFYSKISEFKKKILMFPQPIWIADFSLFIRGLIRESLIFKHPTEASNYFPPMESEIPLSRALYNPKLPYRKEIEKIISYDHAEQIDSIFQLCRKILTPKSDFTPIEYSYGQLILYRNIFDICYQFEYMSFPKTDPELFKKLQRISKLPAHCFLIPFGLVNPSFKTAAKTKTISELFKTDSQFVEASDILICAMFESNPMDALHYVHLSLIKATEVAMSYQKDSSPIPFDDIFSLFLGVFLISSAYDIFQLSWFLETFMPQSGLSPDFEYTRNTVSAIAIYIRQVNFSELSSKNYYVDTI